MKTGRSVSRLGLAVAGVLIAGAMASSCTQTVTVPILLGDGFTIFNKDGLVPGEPIPNGFEVTPLPLCGILPSRADLLDVVSQGLLSPLAGLMTIESVSVKDTTLTVTSEDGDLESLTRLELLWRPGMVNGVDLPDVSFGAAQAATGLSSPLVLTPSESVDFLALLDDASATCPSLVTALAGDAPGLIPEWSLRIRLNVAVHIGF